MNVLAAPGNQAMLSFIEHFAHPAKVVGGIMEVPLPRVKLGELCVIQPEPAHTTVLRYGQVVGFNQHNAIIGLFDNGHGLSTCSRVYPTGNPLRVNVSPQSLGGIYDGSGKLCNRMAQPDEKALLATEPEWRTVENAVPAPLLRQPLCEPFYTGIRVIDGLLTCCKGQRVGIFSTAGGGKSSLLSSLLLQDNADVIVVALIGERGREVVEFIQYGLSEEQRKKTVLVYSTSDAPPVERMNAGKIAMTIAEYFRDHGADVLMLFDSVTRYARAIRDVGFAAGEQATTSGFPPSVFSELPRMLERAGAGYHGSITGFFTVLLESQTADDPVGEEVRSILDGHIYLSSRLAAQNHYPAVDVLHSLSRLFNRVASPQQRAAAGVIRRALQRLEEMKLLLELGEYEAGHNIFTDNVINHRENIMQFLQQAAETSEEPTQTMERMLNVADALSATG